MTTELREQARTPPCLRRAGATGAARPRAQTARDAPRANRPLAQRTCRVEFRASPVITAHIGNRPRDGGASTVRSRIPQARAVTRMMVVRASAGADRGMASG